MNYIIVENDINYLKEEIKDLEVNSVKIDVEDGIPMAMIEFSLKGKEG